MTDFTTKRFEQGDVPRIIFCPVPWSPRLRRASSSARLRRSSPSRSSPRAQRPSGAARRNAPDPWLRAFNEQRTAKGFLSHLLGMMIFEIIWKKVHDYFLQLQWHAFNFCSFGPRQHVPSISAFGRRTGTWGNMDLGINIELHSSSYTQLKLPFQDGNQFTACFAYSCLSNACRYPIPCWLYHHSSLVQGIAWKWWAHWAVYLVHWKQSMLPVPWQTQCHKPWLDTIYYQQHLELWDWPRHLNFKTEVISICGCVLLMPNSCGGQTTIFTTWMARTWRWPHRSRSSCNFGSCCSRWRGKAPVAGTVWIWVSCENRTTKMAITWWFQYTPMLQIPDSYPKDLWMFGHPTFSQLQVLTKHLQQANPLAVMSHLCLQGRWLLANCPENDSLKTSRVNQWQLRNLKNGSMVSSKNNEKHVSEFMAQDVFLAHLSLMISTSPAPLASGPPHPMPSTAARPTHRGRAVPAARRSGRRRNAPGPQRRSVETW